MLVASGLLAATTVTGVAQAAGVVHIGAVTIGTITFYAICATVS
jgi:hypothetical protein